VKTRVFTLTLLAMIAFASNSLLCRAALRDTQIDAATFTFVRILSGALALCAIAFARSRGSALASGNWPSALALFAYAAAFSFAYNTLAAGTGALLLFGAVQATMILWGFRKGERIDWIQIVGLLIALAGLVALVFPGISAPPLAGSVLMLIAGIAWGVYSLRGRFKGRSSSDSNAIATTTGNFVRAVLFAAILVVAFSRTLRLDLLGVIYATISGAITSGLGYVLWYAALPNLKAASAATVQLSVPVIAATGGIVLLNEPITLRYIIASIAVLGGIFLVIIERRSTSAV
jgi:drug/metabolite transporter (DMT)-like permease